MKSHESLKILFPGDDWHLNACINYMPMDYQYIHGYWEAAKLLMAYIIKTKLDQDRLVYPIIFTYRHAIELLIKRIIKDFQRINNIPITLEKNHKIVNLFAKHKNIFIEYGGAIKTNTYQNIINKISLLDPNSESARYPVGLDGRSSIKLPEHIINLKTFAQEAEKVLGFLDEINIAIDLELEGKEEI